AFTGTPPVSRAMQPCSSHSSSLVLYLLRLSLSLSSSVLQFHEALRQCILAQINKGGHQTLQNQILPPQSRSLAKSQPLFHKSFIK
ncbi:hypothetical protein P3370_23505, partial [Vibrio parahaemolyticus]|nr:hypothetical protein [Vibrio parahaemolyticus]